MIVHSYINPYLDQKLELMVLIDDIRRSDNKELFDNYNHALYTIKFRDRSVYYSFDKNICSQFRLTEEQINFIRK